jgi:hypothetical protein
MPGAFPFPPTQPEDDNPDQVASPVVGGLGEPKESHADPSDGDPLASEPPEPPEVAPAPAAELPPEARGEANGGPLGCCLGITVGIMLCLFLGVIGFGQLLAAGIAPLVHSDPINTIRIATGLLAFIGAILGGFCGWKIGKRVYREFELSPRQKQRLEQLEKKYRERPRRQVRSQERRPQ